MDNYGNTGLRSDDSESFADIPRNRTLVAEQLTSDAPLRPEIVQGLQTLQQVFAHYRPEVQVAFEDTGGAIRNEALHFGKLPDFAPAGLGAQSNFLKDITARKDEYFKMINQLQSNKSLKAALSDPDAKQTLLAAIHGMIAELKTNK